jgi:hypothetical protein
LIFTLLSYKNVVSNYNTTCLCNNIALKSFNVGHESVIPFLDTGVLESIISVWVTLIYPGSLKLGILVLEIFLYLEPYLFLIHVIKGFVIRFILNFLYFINKLNI